MDPTGQQTRPPVDPNEEMRLARYLKSMDLLQKGVEGSIETTLKKKYYELALLTHPDKNGQNDEFIRLKEGYEALKEAARRHPELLQRLMQPRAEAAPSPDREIYNTYKSAVKKYFQALEVYFEGKHQVELETGSEAYHKLCITLQEVKNELATVIKKDPAGLWVGDSIEKIGRINVWLKEKDHRRL